MSLFELLNVFRRPGVMAVSRVLQLFDTDGRINGRFFSLVCPIEHCAQGLHPLVSSGRRFNLAVSNSANVSRRHHGDWFGPVLLRDFVECPALPITCAEVQSLVGGARIVANAEISKRSWLRVVGLPERPYMARYRVILSHHKFVC